MGIIGMFSCKSSSDNPRVVHEVVVRKANEPEPNNFKILKCENIGNYLIALINFPNCTTFGGNKVCVYENVPKKEFESLKEIDPHFLNTSRLSPIARFRGDEDGYKNAQIFAFLKISPSHA